MRRPSFAASAVSVAAVLTVGCYTYTPVTPGAAIAGERTRVQLTEVGSFAVARTIGPYANTLDGRIVQRDDSGFVVSVAQVTRRSGVEESWRGEAVRVPNDAVSSITRPKLSRSRSFLLAGSVVATTLGVTALLGGGSILGGSGRGGGSGGK